VRAGAIVTGLLVAEVFDERLEFAGHDGEFDGGSSAFLLVAGVILFESTTFSSRSHQTLPGVKTFEATGGPRSQKPRPGLIRDDQRDYLPAVLSISPKIAVSGEHHGLVAFLGHAHEAGVCETHWGIVVATNKAKCFRHFFIE
jgi:hypothetical protein